MNYAIKDEAKPLALAVKMRNVNIVKLLLNNHADDRNTKASALQSAIHEDMPEVVNLLLESMCSAPERGYLEKALIIDIITRLKYMDTLLFHGADPAYQGDSPWQPYLESALGAFFTNMRRKNTSVNLKKLLNKTGPLPAKVFTEVLICLAMSTASCVKFSAYADQVRLILDHPRTIGTTPQKIRPPIAICALYANLDLLELLLGEFEDAITHRGIVFWDKRFFGHTRIGQSRGA